MDSNTVELSGIWVCLIFKSASRTKSGFVSGGQRRNALLTDLVKRGLRGPRQSCLSRFIAPEARRSRCGLAWLGRCRGG